MAFFCYSFFFIYAQPWLHGKDSGKVSNCLYQGFKFRVVLLDLLSSNTKETSLLYYLTHSWWRSNDRFMLFPRALIQKWMPQSKLGFEINSPRSLSEPITIILSADNFSLICCIQQILHLWKTIYSRLYWILFQYPGRVQMKCRSILCCKRKHHLEKKNRILKLSEK